MTTPKSTPPRILTLGEVLWDIFPDGERFGGAPANFACHAARLGAQVDLVSAVGNDTRGTEALRILERFGVRTNHIQVDNDLSTGRVDVTLEAGGKPTYVIHEPAAWDHLTWSDTLATAVPKADALYFGTLGQRHNIARQTIRQALELARSLGIPRLVDINLRPPYFDAALIRDSIQLATILKLSDEEIAPVCDACDLPATGSVEQIATALQQSQQLDIVLLTRGDQGAVLVSNREVLRQPGIPTQVQDTVGAGDSFTAAMLVGLLQGEPHAEILKQACQIAAEVCQHTSAVPDLASPTPHTASSESASQ